MNKRLWNMKKLSETLYFPKTGILDHDNRAMVSQHPDSVRIFATQTKLQKALFVINLPWFSTQKYNSMSVAICIQI